ncbi:hypothetical protein RHGRI_023697 [Rhododendron griersonianum]|uniref:Uncharacterized protein n=1 Tax=Rhododendron griersonianum TaxID=479676 RepID=A0AAV6J6Q3_9ERIC|nr:hypothetical protein RHGRI_023697 [Rhododendron griersonianum]
MKHTEREREQQEHAATNSDDFGDFDEDYEELRLFRRRTPQGERRTKSISDEASRRRRRTPQGTTSLPQFVTNPYSYSLFSPDCRKIGERRDEFRKKVSRCVRKSQEML